MERKIDKAGRIVIPRKEARLLKIEAGDEVEITLQYGKIHIKKFEWENVEKRTYVGIVRSIDDAGKISVPREYMKVLGIELNTDMNINVNYETKEFILEEVN